MFVIFDVIIPNKLSMAQKRLVKELQETDLEDASEFKVFKKYL